MAVTTTTSKIVTMTTKLYQGAPKIMKTDEERKTETTMMTGDNDLTKNCTKIPMREGEVDKEATTMMEKLTMAKIDPETPQMMAKVKEEKAHLGSQIFGTKKNQLNVLKVSLDIQLTNSIFLNKLFQTQIIFSVLEN